jgi:hypothetical protein
VALYSTIHILVRQGKKIYLVSFRRFLQRLLSFYKTVLAEKPSVLDITCESTSDVEENAIHANISENFLRVDPASLLSFEPFPHSPYSANSKWLPLFPLSSHIEALPLIASSRWWVESYYMPEKRCLLYLFFSLPVCYRILTFPPVGTKAEYVGGPCAQRLDITSDVGR